MPKYRVTSAEMDEVIETPYRADVGFLVYTALERSNAKSLGAIIKIHGGQFRGEDTMYFPTPTALMNMGRISEKQRSTMFASIIKQLDDEARQGAGNREAAADESLGNAAAMCSAE